VPKAQDALFARGLLTPEGGGVASIPMVRSFPMIWRLMIHGNKSITEYWIGCIYVSLPSRALFNMFERQGYVLREVCSVNASLDFPNISPTLWRAFRLINSLFMGNSDDMLFQQFAVVARSAADPAEQMIE
jgi:hypothetical protein